jgi:hypothetical protein
MLYPIAAFKLINACIGGLVPFKIKIKKIRLMSSMTPKKSLKYTAVKE